MQPRWSTRAIVAMSVTAGEMLMLVVCGLAFIPLSRILDTKWSPILDHGGTILITLIGPAAAFWLVRTCRTDARQMSWFLIVLLFIANLALIWTVANFHVELEHHLRPWVLVSGMVSGLFLFALCGTFIRTVPLTWGRTSHGGPGIRIS